MFNSNPSNPLFGTSTTTSPFNIGTNTPTNATAFGRSPLFVSPLSGFGTSPLCSTSTALKPKGLFSTPQQPNFAGTNLFNFQPNTSPGNVFANSQQNTSFSGTYPTPPSEQKGSYIKFTAKAGTDMIVKNGITRTINTKLNNIVYMKEYEDKSQEEIHWEDYECNRKGPQQSSGSSAPTFKQPEKQIFPQVDNKMIFGQVENNKAFGQASTGINNFTNQTPFGSTIKPVGLPATPFGVTPSADKSFPFNPANFGGRNFSSPPVQAQNTFSASPSVTTVSQPITFGTSSFGQANTQGQNSNVFNKPPQTFNFSQIGQTNTQQNLFQAPKMPTTTSSFGKTASDTNFQFPAKTGQTFSFSPTSQNVQNSLPVIQNPPQEQSGYLPDMQAVTNNFMNLHKSPMASNYGFSLPQEQPLVSPFKSDQPDDFSTIVDKIYESFPYRSVFEGISAKAYMDDNLTNPKLLPTIVQQQESLPLTSRINDKTKLRMLSGSSTETSNVNHLKCNWLGIAATTNAPPNNFILTRRSGKHLTLSKNQQNSEERLKELLVNVKNASADKSMLQPIKINEDPPVTSNDKSKINSPHKGIADSNLRIEAKKWETMGKEELISLLSKSFFNEFKMSPEGMRNDHTDSGISDVPGRLSQNKDTVEEQSTQESATPLRAASPRHKIFDTLNTIPEEDELPNPTTSFKPQLKVRPLSNEDFNSKLINCLQNNLQNHKTKESLQIGDNVCENQNLDTCGITLTRKDYYTIPPLEEIHKYRNSKGECVIKGFTIGHYTFGNIYFSDEINICNLNLDEIIQFNLHEAIVYPDDQKKPLLGEGLNRPGQVTLDQVWPRHRTTRKILKNPNEIKEENFVQRLILLSRKQNAEFVDYRIDTGSWVFQVEHFSKFNFSESDDEEIACEIEKKKEIEAKHLRSKGLGGLDACQSHSQDKFFQERSTNVTMLKYSFFNDNTNLAPITDSSPCLNPSSHRNFGGLQKRFATCEPKTFTLFGLNRQVPKKKSLLVSSTDNYMDVGLFKGQSFKTSWGPGFSFVIRGIAMFNTDHEENTSNSVKYLKIGDLSRNPQMMFLKEHLEVVFAESTAANSQIPSFTVNHNHRALILHQNITAESADVSFDMASSYYYSQIWNLCLSFWGPEATTPTNRRELFNKWLEDAADPYIKNELEQSATIKNIFVYLTGHKLTEAAELAEKERCSNLSILITQSSGQESSKQLIRHQLEQWNSTGVFSTMDKNIIKIYMLFGGIPFLDGIHVCENLDWKCALGIYFWYICPAGTSLINSIQAYQHDFFVWGCVNPPTPEGYECINMEVYDLLYQIMMLFVTPTMPLEKVVNPITYTSDPLDYRLSWFLLQVLTALKVGTISEQATNYIHISFSSQLEHLDLWEWSIFVLLFIKDESYKTNAILEILEKNLNPNCLSIQNTNTEDFLVNQFKIPSQWIHSVLANKTRNYIETYKHLILAKDWCKACEIAVEQLIPDLIINAQLKDLLKLLKDLIPGKNDILQWNADIGLILDYLEFNQKITDDAARDFVQLKEELVQICLHVKNFPISSMKQTVAVTELSNSLVNCLRLFYCELQPTKVKNNMQIVINLIKGLPMPADCRQNVLRAMCSIFIQKTTN